MTNGSNNQDNGDNENTGYKKLDHFPSVEEVDTNEQEQNEVEMEAQRIATEIKYKENKKKIGKTTRREILCLIGALFFGGTGVISSLGNGEETSMAKLLKSIDISIDIEAFKKIKVKKGKEIPRELVKILAKAGITKKDKHTNQYIKDDFFKWKFRGKEVVFDEPLITLDKYIDPRTGKTPIYEWTGKPIQLKKSVAEAFMRAHNKMKAAGKGGIQLNLAFRTNAHQWELYQRYRAWKLYESGKGPRPTSGRIELAAPPGLSLHEMGQAVDIANAPEAAEYLLAEGFITGIPNEPWHFQMGLDIKRTGIAERSVDFVLKKGGALLDKGLEKGGALLDKGRDMGSDLLNDILD